MIQFIALVAVVASGAVLLAASRKPDTMRYERTTKIQASPEKIFPHVNNFHSWTAWSPYEKKDPAMNRTYSGAESGKGAVYEWNGNNDVGSGRMEIVESSAPAKIVIKLDFFKPFEGHNTAEFTFEPNGDATKVTWAMHGPSKFITKVMQTIMDMDKMVGTDFAVGLANLKALCEK